MAQVPAKPVEFPYDQSVPTVHGLQAGRQLGAVILLPGGSVFIEEFSVEADGQECIALKIRGSGAATRRFSNGATAG
jgi:hypothetical protein